VADCEDLVQKISVQFWRLFARYDERQEKLSTWLYRIALNVAISQARRALVGVRPLRAARCTSPGNRRWR